MNPRQDDSLELLLRRPRSLTPIDPARAARVRSAVHTAWRQARPERARRGWWVGAVSAAAILVVAMGLLRNPSAPPAGQPAIVAGPPVGSIRFVSGRLSLRQADGSKFLQAGDQVAAGSVILSGPGDLGTVELANGVEVRLDRDTSVMVATDRRLTVERGAIYVDTAGRRGAADPIEVTARGTLVRDIGTRYEVRVLADAMRVRVRDGRVEVSRNGDTREASGGGQVTVSSIGMAVGAAPAFGPDWAWALRAAAPPQVDGRSLADFLAWVQREGGREVRFRDPALQRTAATTTVYGVVDGLTIEEALALVLPSCGLEHRIEGAVIIIDADGGARGIR